MEPKTASDGVKWFWIIVILCVLFAVVAGLVTGYFQFLSPN